MPKNGKNAHFGHFSGFPGVLAPRGPGRPLPRGLFYINPSRRGPVPGSGGVAWPAGAAQARGVTPGGGAGVSPEGSEAEGTAARSPAIADSSGNGF